MCGVGGGNIWKYKILTGNILGILGMYWEYISIILEYWEYWEYIGILGIYWNIGNILEYWEYIGNIHPLFFPMSGYIGCSPIVCCLRLPGLMWLSSFCKHPQSLFVAIISSWTSYSVSPSSSPSEWSVCDCHLFLNNLLFSRFSTSSSSSLFSMASSSPCWWWWWWRLREARRNIGWWWSAWSQSQS